MFVQFLAKLLRKLTLFNPNPIRKIKFTPLSLKTGPKINVGIWKSFIFCLHCNYWALSLKSEPKLLKWNDIIIHIDRAERWTIVSAISPYFLLRYVAFHTSSSGGNNFLNYITITALSHIACVSLKSSYRLIRVEILQRRGFYCGHLS